MRGCRRSKIGNRATQLYVIGYMKAGIIIEACNLVRNNYPFTAVNQYGQQQNQYNQQGQGVILV